MAAQPATSLTKLADRDPVYVFKYDGFIGVPRNVSKTAQKVWNLCLRRLRMADHSARLRGEETPWIINISVPELLEELETTTRNYSWLRKVFEELVTAPAVWAGTGKNSGIRLVLTTWMASAVLEEGEIEFSYSPPLMDALLNPDTFAKLDIVTQGMLKACDHSQPIWEICSAWAFIGYTPWYTVDWVNSALSTNYAFGELNRTALSPALKEINRTRRMEAVMERKNRGRKVTHIRFRVKDLLDKKQEEDGTRIGEFGQGEIFRIQQLRDREKRTLADLSPEELGVIREEAEIYCKREMKEAWDNNLVNETTIVSVASAILRRREEPTS